jgi:hypothetical protein
MLNFKKTVELSKDHKKGIDYYEGRIDLMDLLIESFKEQIHTHITVGQCIEIFEFTKEKAQEIKLLLED